MTEGNQPAVVDVQILEEDAEIARELIEAVDEFGEIDSVNITGEVDVAEVLLKAHSSGGSFHRLDELLSAAESDPGSGEGDRPGNEEESTDEPESGVKTDVSQEPPRRPKGGDTGDPRVEYQGQRREQVTTFLKENKNRWVDWEDFVEWLGVEKEDYHSVATNALNHAATREYLSPVETRYVSKGQGARTKQFRYEDPNEELPDEDVNYENIPHLLPSEGSDERCVVEALAWQFEDGSPVTFETLLNETEFGEERLKGLLSNLKQGHLVNEVGPKEYEPSPAARVFVEQEDNHEQGN